MDTIQTRLKITGVNIMRFPSIVKPVRGENDSEAYPTELSRWDVTIHLQGARARVLRLHVFANWEHSIERYEWMDSIVEADDYVREAIIEKIGGLLATLETL